MKSKNTTISKDRQKKILSLVLKYWKRMLLASFCMVIVAGTTAIMAYLIKPVMDEIFIDKNMDMLVFIPGLAIFVFFLKGLGSYWSEYLMNYVGEKIIRFFRDSLYDTITDLPISFIHKKKTGALMSRITNDVNIVKGMVSTAAINLVRDVFTVIGLTVVIFYQDWKLASAAFLVLPVAFFPIVLFGRRVRRFSTGTQETMADLNSFLHETFTGSKIVKIFSMEAFEKKRFKEKTRELFRLEMKK
ncbi:MAG: ABC transporter permease, partial [Desulfobacteraceae bacterium]|nr:ABC transporter permease [Desulfobacteraceae bacterium]